MNGSIMMAAVIVAVLIFVIGSFCLASRLVGRRGRGTQAKVKPAKKKALPQPKPCAQPPQKRPAVIQPEMYAAAPLQAAPSPVSPLPVSPLPAKPRRGIVEYERATQYTMPENAAPTGSVGGLAFPPVQRQPSGRPLLHLIISGDDDHPDRRIDVAESELPVTIGRGSSDAKGRVITVCEPTVSSQHLRISMSDGVLGVQDLRSTCGTVVSGEGGDAIMLHSGTKRTATNVYDSRFTLALGRLRVDVSVDESALSGMAARCALVMTAQVPGRGVLRFEMDRSFTIGRQNADILLDDLLVSRSHASIRLTVDGQFVITDCGSRNGVINASTGAKIDELVLRKGNRLQLGGCLLCVEDIVRRRYAQPCAVDKTVYVDMLGMLGAL